MCKNDLVFLLYQDVYRSLVPRLSAHAQEPGNEAEDCFAAPILHTSQIRLQRTAIALGTEMIEMVEFDKAFRHDISPITGGYLQVQTNVRRSISGLTRDATAFWIGIASDGEKGCRRRWNDKYKARGMRKMARVYETSSDDFRKNMEAELIDFYEEHAENETGGGGGGTGKPPYSVYVVWTDDQRFRRTDKVDFIHAYREDISPYTGGWRENLTNVRQRISALTQNYHKMWIGIASNGVSGCRERWNSKYKALGMKKMAAVYETSSDDFRKKMEADLIEFYRDHVENPVGGGGGPTGIPPYTVYVVWSV